MPAQPVSGGPVPPARASTELAALVRWAERQLATLVEQVHAQIWERITPYARDGLVPAEMLRRSIAHNMRFMLDALASPGAEHDYSTPTETGRQRARQGMPLPEVLRAYRISFAAMWDVLVERAQEVDDPATTRALLDNVGRLWRLTDEHALALTEGYRAERVEQMAAEQRRRGALVEAVLAGQPSTDPWEAARLLGFPPDAPMVVVVAEARGLADEGLPGVERALAERRMVSAWRLTPAMLVGIVALDEPDETRALDVLESLAESRVGVSPPFGSLVDAPRALHLARVALARIPSGTAAVRRFSPSPLAALVAAKPAESQRLVRQVLGPLDAVPAEDRDVLLATLDAYLDHEGVVDRVAEALHCHPNTVRYRLRRLHQLTGRSTADPSDLAELRAAALALQVLGPEA